MYQVGQGQGNIYDKVEGNAKAFILKGDDKPLEAANEVADLELNLLAKQKADKDKALLAAEAKKKEVQDKIAKVNPEDLWWKHSEETKSQYGKLSDMAADLIGAGVNDPFSGTDPASRAFQTEYAKGMQMIANSNQLNKQYIQDRNEINSNPDKYTDESKLAVLDFYDKNTLGDISSKALLPPELRPTQPLHDKTKYYQTIVDARGNKSEPSDDELFDFAKTALTDKGQKGYLPAMEETYDKLPAKDKARLAKLAEENGISLIQNGKDLSPLVIMAKEEIKPYFSTEPIDIDKIIAENMPAGDITSNATSYENMSGITTSSSTRRKFLDEEKLDAAATGALSVKLLDQLIKEKRSYTTTINGKQETILVTNDKTALEYIKQQMRTGFQSEIETKKGTAIDFGVALDKESGMGKDILDKDQDFYYQALFDVNTPEKTSIAAQFGFDLNKPDDRVKFQSSMYQQAAQAAIGMPQPDGSIVKNARVEWVGRDGQTVVGLNPDITIDDFWNGSGKKLLVEKELRPELVLELEQPVTVSESGDTDTGKKTTSKKVTEKSKTERIVLDKSNPDASKSLPAELLRIYQYKVKKTKTGFGYNRKGELGGEGSDVNTRFQVETSKDLPMNQGGAKTTPKNNQSQNPKPKTATGRY